MPAGLVASCFSPPTVLQMADRAEAPLVVLLDGLSAVPCDERRLLEELCDALQGAKEKGREKEHRTSKREPIPAQRSVLSPVVHTQPFPHPGMCKRFTCRAKVSSSLWKKHIVAKNILPSNCLDAAAGSPRRALKQMAFGTLSKALQSMRSRFTQSPERPACLSQRSSAHV